MMTLYSKFSLNLWLICKCLVFKGDIKSDQKSIKTYNISTMIRVEMVGFNSSEKGLFQVVEGAVDGTRGAVDAGHGLQRCDDNHLRPAV